MTEFAPVELLEFHERLSAEVAAAQKMLTSLAVINNGELREFMKNAITARQRRANEIARLLGNVIHTYQ